MELFTFIELKKNGIDFEYEPKTYELLPKFSFYDEKIRPITYKPDFVGNNFILECKGFPNDAFPLKAKLFKKYLKTNNPNIKYYIGKTQKEILEIINEIKQQQTTK